MDPSDPDFQYLGVDRKKLIAEAKEKGTFDSKKACFVPDEAEGYIKGEIQSTKGNDVTVKTEKGESKTVKKDKCLEMNPPKFTMAEDMANMSYMNEACVFNNLRERYCNGLIYTYSGLFCVVINPFRWLPIYTPSIVLKYRGKRRNEMPPHLFMVADNAYANMLQNRENQSVLITGESGAGKTENTKKVIFYMAQVAAMGLSEEEKAASADKGSLEEQIVQCNPVLEAYGNAKTVRNNNSSRFGKFIRIHFSGTGKIASADIETYLLEKSRVTWQQPVERNYHIFYFLLSNKFPEMHEELKVTPDPSLYFNINQGVLTVNGIDDAEEMGAMDKGFDTLGFTADEKLAIYKATAIVLHMGDQKFKNKGEQAEPEGTDAITNTAALVGVDGEALLKSFVKPKVKVGTEFVVKGQTAEQCYFTAGAFVKSTYDRMFNWLVLRINQSLDTGKHRQYFVGVLDIAGFEIFDNNGLEQLCINYTNECLQQFFNHNMFVLEQEEYKKEGIKWDFIDFGMDLQKTIDCIEKPMGILAILEEECMFPKASDKSFQEKLYQNHLGKSDAFGKPKPGRKGADVAHFELSHYAGTVAYNITGWLNKNKDPLTDAVIDVMRSTKVSIIKEWYPMPVADGKGGGGGKKGKGDKTISGVHRMSLHKLMDNLHSTSPHFVRCLIPNELKKPGLLDCHLVLHQLQCNGVLEGIRICQKGFPSRMMYADFKQRYSILAPNAIPTGFVDGKTVAGKVLGALGLDEDKYRLGSTKVFFRAGTLGTLEEIREDRLALSVSLFQAWVRGYTMRRSYQCLLDQRVALTVIQRNIRNRLVCRDWKWWSLFAAIRPDLASVKREAEFKKKVAEMSIVKEEFENVTKMCRQLEESNVVLLQEKNNLFIQMQTNQDSVGELKERLDQLESQKKRYEVQVKDLEAKCKTDEEAAEKLEAVKRKMTDELNAIKAQIKDAETKLAGVEEEKAQRDQQIRTLQDEMQTQDEHIAKLNKEKKAMEEANHKMADDLAVEQDKFNHLSKVKSKLESALDELEDNLEREKRVRGDVEKVKKKLEGDLRSAQEASESLEQVKRELEEQVRRKDQEISDLHSTMEDQQNLVTQLQKKIKELQARIEELEEELEAERAARTKIEKQRSDLSRDLEELTQRLEEQGGATAQQMETSKKREAELHKIKKDLDEAAVANEQNLTALRKKCQDACDEMAENVDSMNKTKQKIEKEKAALRAELDDLQSQLEHVNKQKAQAEKVNKQLESQFFEVQQRTDETQRQINDLSTQRSRLVQENADLTLRLEDAESSLSQLSKMKSQLQSQVDDTKTSIEEESRMRAKMQGDYRNFQADLLHLRDQLDEEQEGRGNLQRMLAKTQSEITEWKNKFESGAGTSVDEVEEVKRKLTTRVQDAETQLEAAVAKAQQLEKQKQRLQTEIDDLMLDNDRAQQGSAQLEKKQRAFDKMVAEWQSRSKDLQHELDSVHREARQYQADCYRAKSAQDEARDTIDSLRRENKNLADEIRDLTEQMSTGGRSVSEIEKNRKRLEMEKEELRAALEEAEGALSQEEAKVMRAHLELQQIRSQIDRRLTEKDEEFEATRRNQQRALDSMQASLESETKSKQEAMRMKKKLEQDIGELEVAVDGGNRQRSDLEKQLKKYQQEIREIQTALEDEARQRDELREQASMAERKSNMLGAEVEELRAALEQAERNRKAIDTELRDASDRVSELNANTHGFGTMKRRLEQDVSAIQGDLDEAMSEAKNAEEKAKKAMGDAARLAEELRQEQEHSSHLERLRRQLDAQVKELQARLDEADAQGLKGGRRILQRLEQRVRELEAEYDAEQRRHQDTIKEFRKTERRLKEMTFQADEDRKHHERARDNIDKIYQKLKAYKRQAEEAEEVAAVNLAKYRKVQADLEDAEARADSAESDLSRLRARSRTSVSATRAIGGGGTATVTVRSSRQTMEF